MSLRRPEKWLSGHCFHVEISRPIFRRFAASIHWQELWWASNERKDEDMGIIQRRARLQGLLSTNDRVEKWEAGQQCGRKAWLLVMEFHVRTILSYNSRYHAMTVVKFCDCE